ncbi:MAG: pyrroline-5-carboxylate reductase [Nitrospirales bacterium]|nr:MAG: pyrroline-5-carboxylate reductase [Nitrospirales bacterium]
MLEKQKFAFIGAGNMAEALLAGLLQSDVVKPSNIFATDVSQARLDTLKDAYQIQVGTDNTEAVRWATIIIMAVKPQVLPQVLQQVKAGLTSTQLVISIAAGIPLSAIIDELSESASVIRAMPNTPCLVQQGATALAAGTTVTQDHMNMAVAIFEASGKVVVVEEKLMDAVTGLSGSGPAYVYVMIEALADGGVRMGLPRHIAHTLATQTVLGTAHVVVESGEHPGQLKDRVTSPGGTTIAGLHELENGGVRAALMNAVAAATKRSQELGTSKKA